MKYILSFLLILLATASTALAVPMAKEDIGMRVSDFVIKYDVNQDGSYTVTHSWHRTVLKENEIKGAKRSGVTFSTSVAKGEILEAYTLKPSGKRIDAPKSSYQVNTHDGYKKASPLYSDETNISVVFPDLAVGDTEVFAARVINSEGIFPNQFSMEQSFSPFYAIDNATIEIDAPESMNLRTKAYFLNEEKAVVREGKRVLRWTYHNPTPEKWTPADKGIYSVGDEPSLYASTFNSYREIAEAYGARATPKAAVSDRVKKLAAGIVDEKSPPEAQARALYDWVAKNISYGGNCIGVGSVVPRDLSVVLDNKLGDCKDHATLLEALLASRGIESEQALTNASEGYRLPDVPVVSAINHVINYLPGMHLFLDSTSAYTPFGMLPLRDLDKPVLPVSHYREGMKTPIMAQGNEQAMRTTIRVNPDGTATGDLEMSLKGLPAIMVRAAMRARPAGQDDLLAEKMLEYQGIHGKGVLTMDDPAPLLDTFNLKITFTLKDYLASSAPIGMPIKPVTASFLPISGFARAAYEPAPKKPQPCSGGLSVEDYVIEFPPSLKIVAIPKDYGFSGPMIDYRATYREKNHVLTVHRELHDKTATNLCSAEMMASSKKGALDLVRDLKSQVLLSD